MSNERELKTIDLPSGIKAQVITYFTRGEVRAIKQSRWQGSEISVEASENVSGKINPNADDLQDDEIVFQGVKSLLFGEELKPITRELLDELDIKDFDTCLRDLKGLFLGKKGS